MALYCNELYDCSGGGGGETSAYNPTTLADWGQTPPATIKAALDFLASVDQLLSPSIFFVAKAGNDLNTGSSVAPFLTIQPAIDACYASASENCVIMILDDGEYNEQLDFGNMFPRKNIIFKSAIQAEFPTSTVSRPRIWYSGDLILGAPDTSIPARVALEFDSIYLQGGINIQSSVDNCQIHLVLNKCLFMANNYPIVLTAISGVTLNQCAAVDFGNITCTNIQFFTTNDSHVWEYTSSGSVVATFVNDGTEVYVNTSDKQTSIDVSGRKSDLSNINKLFSKGVFNINVVFSIINGGSPINFTASNEAIFRAGNTVTLPEFVNFSLLGCRVNAAVDVQTGASCELVNTYLLDDLNNDGTLVARNSTADGVFSGDGILDAKNSYFLPMTVTADYTQTTNDVVLDIDASGGDVDIQLLPYATFDDQRIFSFRRIDASANTVTITCDGAETVAGAVVTNLNTDESLDIIKRSAGWGVI